jgi:hypothetical protein
VALAPADRAVLGGDLDQARLGLGWVGTDVTVADLVEGAPALLAGVGGRA